MALSNYTELLAAIRTETNKSSAGITDLAIVDAVTRCEAKMNRKLRLPQMEEQTFDTYNAADMSIANRLVSFPTGYIEMMEVYIKLASATDDNYTKVPYVSPRVIYKRYSSSDFYYTMRNQIEISKDTGGMNYTLMMNYFKKWDIASDTTNWLLTNYPDAYLYGSLMECELHTMNDERVGLWRSMFGEVMRELSVLNNPGRDDDELDTSESARMGEHYSTFNILTG